MLSFRMAFMLFEGVIEYWAGLSTEFVVEHVLMRSIKTSGGLTSGQNVTEMQRVIWLLLMPSCADRNFVMQELPGVNWYVSEQHKDTTPARLKQDMEDAFKILHILKQLDPFGPQPSLHSLVSGITAHDRVNIDSAREVGEQITDDMVGKSVVTYTFHKRKRAVTLGMKTAIKSGDTQVQVNPQLLFQ